MKILSLSADFLFYTHMQTHVVSGGGFPWEAQIFSPAYADNRFRPLALLLLITACPALVLIRALNPWVRFRLILLG